MLDKYLRLLETIDTEPLLEMATSRHDALLICQSVGEEIIEHFCKCVSEGPESITFKHHCGEIQDWFKRVERIILQTAKKKISNEQLREWCFYQLSSPEYLISDETVIEQYKQFVTLMIRNRTSSKLVSEIMYEILS